MKTFAIAHFDSFEGTNSITFARGNTALEVLFAYMKDRGWDIPAAWGHSVTDLKDLCSSWDQIVNIKEVPL